MSEDNPHTGIDFSFCLVNHGVELTSSGLSAFTCWVISLVFNQNSVSFLSLQQSSGEARLQLFAASWARHLCTRYSLCSQRAPPSGWVWIRAIIEDRLRGRRDVSKELGWDKKKILDKNQPQFWHSFCFLWWKPTDQVKILKELD